MVQNFKIALEIASVTVSLHSSGNGRCFHNWTEQGGTYVLSSQVTSYTDTTHYHLSSPSGRTSGLQFPI